MLYLRGPRFADVSPNENSVTGLGSSSLSFLPLPNRITSTLFIMMIDFKRKMGEIAFRYTCNLREKGRTNILLPPRCTLHSSPKRTTAKFASRDICLFLSQNHPVPTGVCVAF